ncbi:hsc70-interacting, partial [Paramuricea clavata]
MKFKADQLALLKDFVNIMKLSPAEIHNPNLKFFKDWIESFGGNLPPPPEEPSSETEDEKEPKVEDMEEENEEPKKETTTSTKSTEKDPESDESAESDIEIDNEGVVEPDTDEPQPMGDINVEEVSEDDMTEASEKRSAGVMAMSEGELDKAITLLTEAVLKNPRSAPTYAKRASCYIRMSKPNAAIRDCNRAVELNPDSAHSYKWRGRAYMLLGEWEKAKSDLATACKIDWDDQANEWLKAAAPNALKIEAHKRKQERKREEKEIKERRKRVEAAKK